MKILITKYSGWIGGAEMYDLNLVERLHKEKYAITVITNNAAFKDALEKIGVTGRMVKWYKEPSKVSEKIIFFFLFPYYTLVFFVLLFQEKPDLLYSQSLSDKFYTAFPAQLLHIPVIWIEHGPISPFFGIRLKAVYTFFAKKPETIIAITKRTKSDLLQYDVPPGKIQVIYSGVDTAKYSPPAIQQKKKLREQYGLNDSFTIGFIGALNTAKGIKETIAVWELLHKKDSRIQLLIAGDGPLKQYVEAKRNTYSGIYYLGYSKDTAPLYQLIDVFILPTTHTEGMPLALLEAMASCVPIIVNRYEGVDELITKKTDGIISTHSIAGYTKAIEVLISDSVFYTTMQQHIRQKALQEFSLDILYNKTIKVIHDAVK